jgi:hypothetical protein
MDGVLALGWDVGSVPTTPNVYSAPIHNILAADPKTAKKNQFYVLYMTRQFNNILFLVNIYFLALKKNIWTKQRDVITTGKLILGKSIKLFVKTTST